MIRRLLDRLFTRERVCESCGAPADVRLRDRSTWCFPCHGAALNLGYDRDGGRLL